MTSASVLRAMSISVASRPSNTYSLLMTNNEAIDTVHTMTMSNGTTVTTTWHNTKAEATARAKSVHGASFRKVFECGILGAYRAVTWL